MCAIASVMLSAEPPDGWWNCRVAKVQHGGALAHADRHDSFNGLAAQEGVNIGAKFSPVFGGGMLGIAFRGAIYDGLRHRGVHLARRGTPDQNIGIVICERPAERIPERTTSRIG